MAAFSEQLFLVNLWVRTITVALELPAPVTVLISSWGNVLVTLNCMFCHKPEM